MLDKDYTRQREYISAMSGKKDADVDEFMIAYGKTLAPKVSYSIVIPQ